MNFEIPEFLSAAKPKTSDRFIPHRGEFESNNFDVKHLIFSPDRLGSTTSPYEMGSAYLSANNSTQFSDASDTATQTLANTPSDS